MRIEQETMVLLSNLIKEQKLGMPVTETPMIIYLDGAIYPFTYLVDETEDYLSIMVVNEEGRQHAKVLNKQYIQSIEILYLDQVMKHEKRKDKEGMYG